MKSCSRDLKDSLSSWTDRKKMKRKESRGKWWAVCSLFRSHHLNIQLFGDGGKNAKSLASVLYNLNLNDSLFPSFLSKFAKIISMTQSNEVCFQMWSLNIISVAGADLWPFKTNTLPSVQPFQNFVTLCHSYGFSSYFSEVTVRPYVLFLWSLSCTTWPPGSAGTSPTTGPPGGILLRWSPKRWCWSWAGSWRRQRGSTERGRASTDASRPVWTTAGWPARPAPPSASPPGRDSAWRSSAPRCRPPAAAWSYPSKRPPHMVTHTLTHRGRDTSFNLQRLGAFWAQIWGKVIAELCVFFPCGDSDSMANLCVGTAGIKSVIG